MLDVIKLQMYMFLLFLLFFILPTQKKNEALLQTTALDLQL